MSVNVEEGQITAAQDSTGEGGNNEITTKEKVESSGGEDAVASGSKVAKIIGEMEIQSAPVSFVGLGKEDLLVLANRPFWVRLRWALFITFWLIWLALLVGAALLIALSPGCEITEIATESSSSRRR